jgi:putative mycofactocin binding protein MftB
LRPSDRIRLDSGVSLREERFGALAYSYRDRQLLFIDRRLLPFVGSDGERSVGEIADELVGNGLLEAESVPRLMLVLEGLRRKGIVHVVV